MYQRLRARRCPTDNTRHPGKELAVPLHHCSPEQRARRTLDHHRLAAIHEQAAEDHERDARRFDDAGHPDQAAVERLFSHFERAEARRERKAAFLGLAPLSEHHSDAA